MSDFLASPGMVLPFLYLALGAPHFIAVMLLPCMKAARMVVEVLISPYMKVGERAKIAMILPNLVIAGALAVIALSAEALPIWLAGALFLSVAIVLGLCNGIWNIGSNHIYGTELNDSARTEIVFTQVAGSCLLATLAVWLTLDLMSGDTPFERHQILLWLGIASLLISCLCLFQVVTTKPEPRDDGADTGDQSGFFSEVAAGWLLAIRLRWYRRFLIARVFFLSVELAVPFYTIHAATYHLSTPHVLSIFVSATCTGTAVGALLWKRVMRRSVRLTLACASLVAAASALLALAFDYYGLASNAWIYAATIFFLSFGIGGVQNGRYLYLLSMSSDSQRPYMVAFGDVVAGLGGILFAAALGLMAEWKNVLWPLMALVALNAAAAILALGLREPAKEDSAQAH